MIIPFECSRTDIANLKERVEKLEYIKRLRGTKTFKHAPYDKEAESTCICKT